MKIYLCSADCYGLTEEEPFLLMEKEVAPTGEPGYWFNYDHFGYREEYSFDEGWRSTKKEALEFAADEVRELKLKLENELYYWENRLDELREFIKNPEALPFTSG